LGFDLNFHETSLGIIISVKLLVIVIIVYERYPSTYCLMQGSYFICGNSYNLKFWSSWVRAHQRHPLFSWARNYPYWL